MVVDSYFVTCENILSNLININFFNYRVNQDTLESMVYKVKLVYPENKLVKYIVLIFCIKVYFSYTPTVYYIIFYIIGCYYIVHGIKY